MQLDPTDIIKLYHGQIVIARGEHRRPAIKPSCDNCRYDALQRKDVPCVNCRWDGDKITQWEPKGAPLTETKPTREATGQCCEDCKHSEVNSHDEPCVTCQWDGDKFTLWEEKS